MEKVILSTLGLVLLTIVAARIVLFVVEILFGK